MHECFHKHMHNSKNELRQRNRRRRPRKSSKYGKKPIGHETN